MTVVVYGVVEPGTRLPRGTTGIDGRRPRPVEADRVAALVGDLEREELLARRRDLRAHLDVLAAALDRSTVVPLQFGVVMADDADVRAQLLEPLRDELRDLLDRFENLVEMRLSSRYEEQPLLAEIVSGDAGVRRLHGVAGAELELGERVAAAYERVRARDAGALLEQLDALVEDEVRSEGGEWDLLTTSFLVRRAHLPALEAAVERWAAAQAGHATCELAGPMPPYSFVELAAPEAAWA